MKISDSYSYVDQTSLRSGVSTKPKDRLASAAPSSDEDVVQGVFAQAAAQRADKVAQLQQQVQSGQYKVNDQAVSTRLVDAHLT